MKRISDASRVERVRPKERRNVSAPRSGGTPARRSFSEVGCPPCPWIANMKRVRSSHCPLMDRANAFRPSVRKRPAYPRSVSLAVSLLTSLLFLTLPLHAATFNATDYGAVGDDSTDNTAAFTACLKAVIAAGGGKMFKC